MALVANEDGFQLHVWPADHPPPHVHVRKNRDEIRVEIGMPGVAPPRWMSHTGGLLAADVRFAIQLVQKHQSACLTKWRLFHGQ